MDLLSSNQIKTNKNILKKTKPKTNINTLIIFAFARHFVCKTRINGVKLSGPKDLPVSTALPKRIRKVGVLCIPVLLFFRLFSFHLFLYLVLSPCVPFFCTSISTVCHLFMCVYSISSTKSLSLSVSISVFYYFCLYCLYVLLFIFLCHSLHFHRISVSISMLIFSSVSLFFVLKHSFACLVRNLNIYIHFFFF